MTTLRLKDSPAAVLVALIAFISALTWSLAIPDAPEFSFDDQVAIIGNPVVEGSLPAAAAFERDYWHHIGDAGHYRPLATLLLRWDHGRALRGDGSLDPAVFRRTNVALHVALLLILGLALIRLDVHHGLGVPWFGFGLFALHPAGADVVAWISGRTSLVSGLGAAIGILLATCVLRAGHARRSLAVAFASGLIGVGIALLGKEDGVVLLIALPVACAWCGGRRAALASVAGGAIAVACVGLLRAAALGSALPSSPTAPLAHMDVVERIGFGLAAWWEGLAALATPWIARAPSLHMEDLTSRPGVTVRALLLVALAAATVATLAWSARRSPRDERWHWLAGLAGLGLVAASAAPLVQLVPAGELFAPRFLYQPLLLGAYATTAIAGFLLTPLRRDLWRSHVQVVVLAGCAALVPSAAAVYTSRESYWEAHLPAHAGDARVWNALGTTARGSGDLDLARSRFERAVELDPNYSRPRTNLGTLAIRRGDLEGAERWLRAAVATGPGNPVAHGNLGNVLLRRERPEEAVTPYERAVELAPGRGELQRGLARAMFRSGDLDGARTHAERALELDPGDGRAQGLLGEIEAAVGSVGADRR